MKFIPITDTPHYLHALEILEGETTQPGQSKSGYLAYIEKQRSIHGKNASAIEPAERFSRLFDSLKTKGYVWQTDPIFVTHHWKRQLPLGRWDVVDGFHRLAILAALGESKIKVCTLRHKETWFKRLQDRLWGIYVKKFKSGHGDDSI